MKKFNLAIDLDGVLINMLPLIQKTFKEIPSDPITVNFEKLMTPARYEILKDLFKDGNWVKQAPFYSGAKEFVSWIKETFNDVYTVTARVKQVEKQTKFAMKELGLNPEKLITISNKEKVIPDLNVLAHIEDDPKQLDNLKSYLKLVIPLRSWNKEWIRDNMGDYNIYPYKSFDHARSILEEFIKKEGEDE